MESEWRLNVIDLGWSRGPYGLIARVSGAPFGLWIGSHLDYDGQYTVFNLPLSTGIITPIGTVAIPSAHPHFPYGVSVLPD